MEQCKTLNHHVVFLKHTLKSFTIQIYVRLNKVKSAFFLIPNTMNALGLDLNIRLLLDCFFGFQFWDNFLVHLFIYLFFLVLYVGHWGKLQKVLCKHIVILYFYILEAIIFSSYVDL